MLTAASLPADFVAPPPMRIGPVVVDPPVLSAPMAGYTDFAYRQLVRRLGGVGLPATEMFSARGFLGRDARHGTPPERLWGVVDEPRPLAVQTWDNDPETLAAVGARLAHEFRASMVDINFGCPVRDVSEKAQSGSYLLRYPDRIGRIVAAVAAACAPVPVTAKIRLGATRDTINAIDVAQAIEASGGQAVTVHGRTAGELFRGRADWDEIARIKPHVRIPLVGNGDLTTPQAAVDAFRYGVDGIMIGRAALGRPWLFCQIAAALAGRPIPPDPTLDQQRQLLLDHYELVCRQHGPEDGTIHMRKIAACYAHGWPGCREFRGQLNAVCSPVEFHALVERYFPREA